MIAAAGGMLGAALVFQFGFDLAPCVLCHYQRYAHVAAALGALPGLFLAPALFMVLSGLGFAASAGLGVFHVGVEQKWWEGTAGCHAPAFDPNLSIEELTQQMLNTDFVACDEVAWSLFGLSMPGWNALISILLALAAGWAAAQLRRS